MCNSYSNNMSLSAISPIDGRYHDDTKELQDYFSEIGLMRYRLIVEIEYLIALSQEEGVRDLPKFHKGARQALRSWYKVFNEIDAELVKNIEATTNHDVKAIEYFLKKKLEKTPLRAKTEFVHFALTSEDVNNLAYSLMWQDAIRQVYLPELEKVIQTLHKFALRYVNTPMLSLTHGQSATPTTVGKEFMVTVCRLKRQLDTLKNHKLQGKLGGATGTWSAHTTAYPNIDWLNFSGKFISALGLEPNLITTQIENHDSVCESYMIVQRINSITIDFCRDVWLYISRGVFSQIPKEGEIGSSTMPHKINPIQFENAEGNLGIANAYFSHLSQKLPISRLQRDLSDSTVLRNQGVPLAHSLLACKNIQKGMSRLTVNINQLNIELEASWEVLAEAIQTIMRKHGVTNAYEKLKELTRGETISQTKIKEFVNNLDIPINEKNKLLKLTPQTYIGLSNQLINLIS
jgi:adenylosuccinate lyase